MDPGFIFTLGDPSLRGGNGIPPRCVYLEEMAADLDGQDWLDMDNIEQVRYQQHVYSILPTCLFPHNKGDNVCYKKLTSSIAECTVHHVRRESVELYRCIMSELEKFKDLNDTDFVFSTKNIWMSNRLKSFLHRLICAFDISFLPSRLCLAACCC